MREALSQVQMLYARETQGGGEGDGGGGGEPGPGPTTPEPGPERPGTEPPPRLWTPPGVVVTPIASLYSSRRFAAGRFPAASD